MGYLKEDLSGVHFGSKSSTRGHAWLGPPRRPSAAAPGGTPPSLGSLKVVRHAHIVPRHFWRIKREPNGIKQNQTRTKRNQTESNGNHMEPHGAKRRPMEPNTNQTPANPSSKEPPTCTRLVPCDPVRIARGSILLHLDGPRAPLGPVWFS